MKGVGILKLKLTNLSNDAFPKRDSRRYGTGAVIWRGLHARCGVIYGLGPTRKPLNTGRADYFGAIPNLAARVCATAQYGQTLIEPTMKLKGATWDKQEVHGTLAEGTVGGGSGGGGDIPDGPGISLKMLGSFTLKGVSKLAVLAQALPEPLATVRRHSFAGLSFPYFFGGKKASLSFFWSRGDAS